MVLIHEIVNIDRMQEHIDRKEVSQRFHPEFPELSILNYTDKVQIEGIWTHETRTARGLIFNLETREVLARPFAKFFNYGQEKIDYDLDAPLYHVGNKFDGSLGIVYRRPDGRLAVATRGSFESEQAIHASELIDGGTDQTGPDALDYYIEQGFTPLCEIIYPENRIVVDYGKDDYLADLGIVEIAKGDYTPPLGSWNQGHTMRDMLGWVDRPNSEGWVLWTDSQTAVKIKQQDYIELHRIVTGLSRKSVWRALSKGEDEFKALLEQLPDELYAWADGVAKELRENYAAIMREADFHYQATLEDWDWSEGSPQEIDRKLFAQDVAANTPKQYAGFMFAFLDGKIGQVQDKIWRMVEPSGSER